MTTLQGDDHTSPGDLMREVRKLRREVAMMKAERRLEAASIGAGGLTVEGGEIVILDADGNETARFATDGLTIEGFLDVLGDVGVEGGVFRWEDDDGDVRIAIGLQGTIDWPDAESVRLIYADDAGVQRVIVGEILAESDGSFKGHGIFAQLADGTDVFSAFDGRGFLGAGGGFARFEDGFDDELELYDADGNFRVTVGPVTSFGSPDGLGIFLTDGAGTDRFFASASRIWLRTTDGHEGNIEAGAVDSGGSGFRVLRIPN